MNNNTDEYLRRNIRVAKARLAIVAVTKGARGVGGVIDCPACSAKSSLHYSIARCNGHIHARCSTPGCVSWME